MRVLVIDNYDSFVFNLVQYLGQLGVDCDVRRNDEISVDEVGAAKPAGILLSPARAPRNAPGSACRSSSGMRARSRSSACASAIRRSARPSAPR
ncbi:hypothetical protein GCM10027610_121130 [Dactylosporangium cerinum]